MRSEKLLKNTVVGVTAQFMYSFIDWLTRTVFIYTMSDQYLGARGLFSSILSFLSLAELGIGTVLVYSMYKPLIEKDEKKLLALTQFYRKAYNLIGLMVFLVGMSLMPFLPFFIKNHESVPYANWIYFLYLVNSSLSYLNVYKQSILNADQRNYVISIYSLIINIIQCAFQVALLLLTHNFFAFLGVYIVITVLRNFILTRKTEKLYPFLKSKEKVKLSKEERRSIYKNVFAMFNHRVGSTVLGSTDNLLISKFIDIIYCGFYDNFKMLTGFMNSFLCQFFGALMASVGNLTASESKEESYRTFRYLHFMSFWMYTFCTVSFIELANTVVLLCFHKDKYAFGFGTIVMIGINFYIMGIRKVPLTFKEAMGLLWQDRYKPIVESIINVVISILFIKSMGIAGILLGTIISMTVTSLWVEPLVLFKYGFEMKWGKFWARNFIYFFVTGVSIAITHYIDSFFDLTGWADLFAKLGVCLVVPNLIIVILFCFTQEFKDLFKALFGLFLRKLNKNNNNSVAAVE